MRDAPAEMDEAKVEVFAYGGMRAEPGFEVAVGALPIGPLGSDGAHGGAFGARIVDVERLQDK